MRQFKIQEVEVGIGKPCFIIAEMALFHDGSLGMAHAFIDAAAAAGANAVKFQTHIAEAESSREEKFRVPIFPQDKTRFEYWQSTSFNEEQWLGLKRHADEKKLVFLSTPFSIDAARMLKRVGVEAWKIGSGETNNLPMLEELCSYQQPILLSTGMSYYEEIDQAVELFKSRKIPLLLYQCTNRYPCPPELVGLNVLKEYQDRYQIPVGLSDHSGKIGTGISAVTLGACSLEVHITWDRRCFGPDVSSSLTFDEFGQLCANIRFVETILANPVSKDSNAQALEETRRLFTKSIAAAVDIPKGALITLEMLAFRKPGTGIPAQDYKNIVGRNASRAIGNGEFLKLEDLR